MADKYQFKCPPKEDEPAKPKGKNDKKVDESEEVVPPPPEVMSLYPRAIFGINGGVDGGLHAHPDGIHIIYPLGTKIGIEDIKTCKQEFVSGHTNTVSCVDVSKSGQYLASGQVNHMGFRAYVIIWDYYERKEIARHDLHKVLVQAICFTAAEKYVVSVGGKDDGSVIVFDMETSTPICRAVAARCTSGDAISIRALNKNPSFFIVAGDRHLRMWSIQREQKKLQVHDFHLGKHQRRFTGIHIDKSDEFAYLGTMTGDIVKVVINCCHSQHVVKIGHVSAMVGAYGTLNTKKPYGKDCSRYVNGVRCVTLVDEGLLLIGAGDGVLELVEERKDVTDAMFKDYPSPTWPKLRTLKHVQVNGSISSLCRITTIDYYVATTKNEIYRLNIKNFSVKLLKTCHEKSVYGIKFPKNLSSVFATAGYENIRIWSTKRLQELLRIMVYNFHCASMDFTSDGTSIISAWNDGVIRSFTPVTGRLIFSIPNAHNKGCSALCVSHSGRVLVTGGIEGQVRVWKVEPFRQSLVGVLKDHSGPISCLAFNGNETEVISASSDGSCVVWDITHMARKQVITANTQFMGALYFPTSVQILTCGSDGRISYWMSYNGGLIRELEGSRKTSVNGLSISKYGDYFVSVGSDQKVKVWNYNSGEVVCQGDYHADPVLSVSYSPCGKFFVTGSSDGCVIIWDMPEEFWSKASPDALLPKLPSTFEVAKPEVTEPEQVRSSKSLVKQENISALLASTPKGNICCVECPPIQKKKMPDANAKCDFVPDIRKC